MLSAGSGVAVQGRVTRASPGACGGAVLTAAPTTLHPQQQRAVWLAGWAAHRMAPASACTAPAIHGWRTEWLGPRACFGELTRTPVLARRVLHMATPPRAQSRIGLARAGGRAALFACTNISEHSHPAFGVCHPKKARPSCTNACVLDCCSLLHACAPAFAFRQRVAGSSHCPPLRAVHRRVLGEGE